MKLLILNLGSTSFKFKLYDYNGSLFVVASGEINEIGSEKSGYIFKALDKTLNDKIIVCKNHYTAFNICINDLKENNLLNNLNELTAVVYKAVHGGKISGTVKVDDDLISEMERMIPLAPKHNPVYIETMKIIQKEYPNLLQIAHFETSFHHSIPEYRVVYGIPYNLYKEYGIRRYGFHGSSHEYISKRIKELNPHYKKLISIHLGGSCSICAINEGKSIASSMGATPQSGLFQNNRVGDLDCFAVEAIAEKEGGYKQAYELLSNESGLKGLSGISNSMKDVIDAYGENKQAKLAIDAFVDNIVGYIGMFIAYLSGVDTIVFTGGIGSNSSLIRELVCQKLDFIGVNLDKELNGSKERDDCLISSKSSNIKVFAITTNEEYILALSAIEYINSKND